MAGVDQAPEDKADANPQRDHAEARAFDRQVGGGDEACAQTAPDLIEPTHEGRRGEEVGRVRVVWHDAVVFFVGALFALVCCAYYTPACLGRPGG